MFFFFCFVILVAFLVACFLFACFGLVWICFGFVSVCFAGWFVHLFVLPKFGWLVLNRSVPFRSVL